MNKRNIGLCIVLSIVTCGIYSLIWMASLTNEVSAASEDYSTSGGMVVLLDIVTCGIYGIYWAYKMGQKVSIAKERYGRYNGQDNSIIYLLLQVFGLGIINLCLIQNELNTLD